MTAPRTHRVWCVLPTDVVAGEVTAPCAEGPDCAVLKLKEAEERFCKFVEATDVVFGDITERRDWEPPEWWEDERRRAEAFLDSLSSDGEQATGAASGGQRGESERSMPRAPNPSEDSQSAPSEVAR